MLTSLLWIITLYEKSFIRWRYVHTRITFRRIHILKHFNTLTIMYTARTFFSQFILILKNKILCSIYYISEANFHLWLLSHKKFSNCKKIISAMQKTKVQKKPIQKCIFGRFKKIWHPCTFTVLENSFDSNTDDFDWSPSNVNQISGSVWNSNIKIHDYSISLRNSFSWNFN